MFHSAAARAETIAPVPPAPRDSRKSRPSNPPSSSRSPGAGLASGDDVGPSASSATTIFARTCGAPDIHVTRCQDASTRGDATYVRGSLAKTSNGGGVGLPGARLGARISNTQCCRKSVPTAPTSPRSSPLGDGDRGVRSAALSACSMYVGYRTTHAPRPRLDPRRSPPASAAAPTPTTESRPKDGMPSASAAEGSMAYPGDAVSRTNHPGVASPSNLGSTRTCPPSPRAAVARHVASSSPRYAGGGHRGSSEGYPSRGIANETRGDGDETLGDETDDDDEPTLPFASSTASSPSASRSTNVSISVAVVSYQHASPAGRVWCATRGRTRPHAVGVHSSNTHVSTPSGSAISTRCGTHPFSSPSTRDSANHTRAPTRAPRGATAKSAPRPGGAEGRGGAEREPPGADPDPDPDPNADSPRDSSRARPRLPFLRVVLFEPLRSGSATVAGGGAATVAIECSRTSASRDDAVRRSLMFSRRRATSPLSHCPVRIHDTRVDLCSPSRASTRHAPPPSSTRHARSDAGSNPERLSSGGGGGDDDGGGGGGGGGGGDEGDPGAASSRGERRVTSSAKPMPRSASNARVHDASMPRLTPTPRTTAARRGTETSAGASGSREEASGRRDAAAAARTSNTPSSGEARGGEGARVEPGRRARRSPRRASFGGIGHPRGRWSTTVERLLRAPPGKRQADETRVGNAMPSNPPRDEGRARSGLSARGGRCESLSVRRGGRRRR